MVAFCVFWGGEEQADAAHFDDWDLGKGRREGRWQDLSWYHSRKQNNEPLKQGGK
jgi:hypothetical protein